MLTWTGRELMQGACRVGSRPVPQCFEVTRVLRPCANSLALCHSTFADEAQHLWSSPSQHCAWYGSVRRSSEQLNAPGVVRISHQLWRICPRVATTRAQKAHLSFEELWPQSNMLSVARLAFVPFVTFWEVFFTF